mmetsp:Transcript_16152/g.66762  ORF Transcript_16152/g.66762 Transcript_16152/m.66762 type:complete len:83 (-) Transcript_16152:1617-1865(-)
MFHITAPAPGYALGLDGLEDRCKEYYKQGARFAKWRTTLKVFCLTCFLSKIIIVLTCATLILVSNNCRLMLVRASLPRPVLL